MKTALFALLFFGCTSPSSRIAAELPAAIEPATVGTCSSVMRAVDKRITKTVPFDYAPDGSAKIAGNADVVMNVSMQFVVEQEWRKTGCSPIRAALESVRFDGSASIAANARIEGGFRGPYHVSRSLADMVVLDGPISVDGLVKHARIELPIEAGLDASAPLEAGLDVHFETHARIDVTCDGKECDGHKSATFDFHPNDDAHAGFNVRALVSPWAKLGLSVRTDDKTTRFGVRTSVDADFWGYYGNGCGDEQFVQASTVDENMVALVDAHAFDDSTQSWEIGRWALGFWDLLPERSSALAPNRPCNPYGSRRTTTGPSWARRRP